MILAIETSCDDTCAAVVGHDAVVRSSVRSSQDALHATFGGVVPEVASRRHLELAVPVVERALDDAGVALAQIDRVAVTQGPGLIGALLVGVATAKAIAVARQLPLVPVDHLYGHVAALRLAPLRLPAPFACLLVSGGHSLLIDVERYDRLSVLGGTLDDAAGEAFDKGARLLGLPFPGGPQLEALGEGGDPRRFPFPEVLRDRPLEFSFSGVKTSLLYRIRDLGDAAEDARADLAASFQAAVVSQLASRARALLAETGRDVLAVVGGVAANGRLREQLGAVCAASGARLALLPASLCVDNAAMIAAAALDREGVTGRELAELDAFARSPLSAR